MVIPMILYSTKWFSGGINWSYSDKSQNGTNSDDKIDWPQIFPLIGQSYSTEEFRSVYVVFVFYTFFTEDIVQTGKELAMFANGTGEDEV